MSLDTDSVCPKATWRELPFLPSPTPGFNPTQWTPTQRSEYAKSTLLFNTLPNVIFFGMAVILLAMFLIWRLVRALCGCCDACAGPRVVRRKSVLSFEVVHDPWLRVHKMTYAFFGFATVALAIAGMATFPKVQKRAQDLAGRLEIAAAFTSEVLRASDALQGSALQLRPLLGQAAAYLQAEVNTTSLAANTQCASSFMDSAFNRTSAAVLNAQLLEADSALGDGSSNSSIAAALAAVDALLAATSGPQGATPGLAAAAALPGLLSGINTSLLSYRTALEALPSPGGPEGGRGQAVAGLQAAQTVTTSNLDPWRSALESTRTGLLAAAAAAQQQTYTQLAAALQQLLSTANATSTELLVPLAAALQYVDVAYLGQAAARNATGPGGRGCVLGLAEGMQHLQESFFMFQKPPGVGPVVHVVLELDAALRYMYDAAAAVTANSSSNSSGLAAAVAAVRERLAALAGINATAVASGCAAVQGVLTPTNGSSALPDVGPTVGLLTQLIARLDAMVPSVQLVSQKLSLYGNSTTSESYGELYDIATALDGLVGNATSLLAVPAPAGMPQVVLVASNASAVAGGALQGQLLTAGAVVQGTEAWMQAAPYKVDAAMGVLGAMASGMIRVAGAMVQGQEAQLAAAEAAEGGNGTTTTGTAGDLPAFSLSALVAPYQQEVAGLLQLLSNGMAAVQMQLDGAFGRVITPAGNSTADQTAYYSTSSSSSMPVASSVSADPLTPLPQPSPPPAPAANASTQIRQELVRRIENVILEVNGSTAERYMDLTFWGSIALYTALIIACLLLFISLWFNYPAGIVSTLLLFLLLLTAVLAGAWALSMSLVGASDFCASTNTIVMQSISAGATLYPLARFYLQGVGGNLQNVLRTSGLGDTYRIAAAISAVQQQLVDPFLLPSRADSTTAAAAAAAAAAAGLQLPDPTTDGAWPGASGTVGYGLGGLLVDAGSLAVTAANELNTFLMLADRAAVMGQFQYVQSWGCCTVAGDAFVAWVCATACGLLAWVAAMAACLVQKNLDDMPGSGCCACKCYDPSDYQPSKRGAYNAIKRGSTSGGGGGGGGASGSRSAAAYLAGGAGGMHAPHPSPARLLQQQHSRRQGMLVHTPQSIQEQQQQQGLPGSRAATPPDGIGRSSAAASAAAAALGGTPTRSRSTQKKMPNEIDPDGPAAQLGLWDLATAPPLPAGHQHDWSPTVRIVRSPRDTAVAGGVRPSVNLTVLDEQTAAMLGLGGGQGQGHREQQQQPQQQ